MTRQQSRERRRALGQHFLVDPGVARRIVQAFQPSPDDLVLEVGPGEGALTTLVSDRVRRLVAVEKDSSLAAALPGRMAAIGAAETGGLELVRGDLLDLDLATLPFPDHGAVRVLSNLPYSVATAILEKLFGWDRVRDLVVMVQKEVAQRLLAPPSTPQRGYLSVLREVHAEGRTLFDVHPGAFRPPPRVISTVLHLQRHGAEDAPVLSAARRGLLRLVSRGFTHRRKTLYNNLRSAVPISPEGWHRLCRAHDLDPRVRAEALSLSDWIAIHRALPPGNHEATSTT